MYLLFVEQDEGTTFDHIFLVSDGVPSLSGGAERVLKAAESFITRASATVRKVPLLHTTCVLTSGSDNLEEFEEPLSFMERLSRLFEGDFRLCTLS